MVGKRLSLSILTTTAVLTATAAQAADYPQPPPPPPVIVPPPDCCNDWYLRGDIGFSNQEVGTFFNENYALYDSVETINKNFDAAPFFGIGIGYNVNNWFRFDVTGEYRGRANFHGYDIGNVSGTYTPDRYFGSKSEWTFLLNGYIDLGTWYCVTPFIGAGIGISRNTISNFGDVSIRTVAGTTSDVYAETTSNWDFAWALYAGLAYSLTKNVTIELAYRYMNLGDATTGRLYAYDGSTDPSYTPFEFQDLTSHDIKLGIRFNLDPGYVQPAPVPYYAPPPPPVYAPPPAYPPPLQSRG